MEQQNYTGQYIQEDEIDIMEYVMKLLAKWKMILSWCGIAAVLGLVIAFSLKNFYTVKAELAPELSNSKSSSMSSLAALAGVSLGSSTSSTTGALYPDLYPEIISSVPFVTSLFDIPVDVKDGKEIIHTDLYDYTLNYTKAPWWNKVIALPFKALGWGMSLFREKEAEEDPNAPAVVDPTHLTKKQAKAVKALRQNISVMVDKKTFVISITATAQDPKVAYDIADEVIKKLQKHVSGYRTSKAVADCNYYEKLNAEARENYYAAQQAYARYVDANQGLAFQRVRTEEQRLQNEMNLAYNLYNQTAQQLQAAKAKVQEETPIFAVINPPTIPIIKAGPSKAKTLLAIIFLGGCCACAWVLWGQTVKDFFKTVKDGREDQNQGGEGK